LRQEGAFRGVDQHPCTLLPTCTKNSSKSMRLLASLSITTHVVFGRITTMSSDACFTLRVTEFYSHSWMAVSEKTTLLGKWMNREPFQGVGGSPMRA
jgi:hypothetical protein